MMNILGIIPSRYASSRFPGKPLVDIGGKSMIRRVYEQANKSKLLSQVVVATDDERIFNEVKSFNGKVTMTSVSHHNGTERCAEVAGIMEGYDYIVNIQGDEPFIKPEQIDTLARLLNGNTQLATLIKEIKDPKQLSDPNVVKVVFNRFHEAMYFSRNAIPYIRDHTTSQWFHTHLFYKHIGIYAYRTDILFEITRLQKSSLETAESLEQLRWLESGYKIKVGLTEFDSIGIDSPADLGKIQTNTPE